MKTRRWLAVLGSFVVLLCLAVPRREAAHAQLSPPIQFLSLIVAETSDAHGIVVTWTLSPAAPPASGFAILRRSSPSLPASASPIAYLTPDQRAYSDYTVFNPLSAAAVWCYQVAAIVTGVYAYTSGEVCVGFAPGYPGPGHPTFTPGCNVFYQNQPASTPAAQVVAHFNPPDAVVSIWQFDYVQRRLIATYFASPGAPLDSVPASLTLGLGYVCLSAAASYS